MKGCLQWIMIADVNGITPYFGNCYAEDLRKAQEGDPLPLGDKWHLEWAKTKSRRVKQGKDPWQDDPPATEAPDHGMGDQT